jgi:hypothetical protein
LIFSALLFISSSSRSRARRSVHSIRLTELCWWIFHQFLTQTFLPSSSKRAVSPSHACVVQSSNEIHLVKLAPKLPIHLSSSIESNYAN